MALYPRNVILDSKRHYLFQMRELWPDSAKGDFNTIVINLRKVRLHFLTPEYPKNLRLAQWKAIDSAVVESFSLTWPLAITVSLEDEFKRTTVFAESEMLPFIAAAMPNASLIVQFTMTESDQNSPENPWCVTAKLPLTPQAAHDNVSKPCLPRSQVVRVDDFEAWSRVRAAFHPNQGFSVGIGYCGDITASTVDVIMMKAHLEVNRKMLEEQLHTDCVLTTRDHIRLPCHKAVLSAHSVVFREIIELASGDFDPCNIDVEMDETVVKMLLEFIYFGRFPSLYKREECSKCKNYITRLDTPLVQQLLEATSTFQISSLEVAIQQNLKVNENTPTRACICKCSASQQSKMNLPM